MQLRRCRFLRTETRHRRPDCRGLEGRRRAPSCDMPSNLPTRAGSCIMKYSVQHINVHRETGGLSLTLLGIHFCSQVGGTQELGGCGERNLALVSASAPRLEVDMRCTGTFVSCGPLVASACFLNLRVGSRARPGSEGRTLGLQRPCHSGAEVRCNYILCSVVQGYSHFEGSWKGVRVPRGLPTSKCGRRAAKSKPLAALHQRQRLEPEMGWVVADSVVIVLLCT